MILIVHLVFSVLSSVTLVTFPNDIVSSFIPLYQTLTTVSGGFIVEKLHCFSIQYDFISHFSIFSLFVQWLAIST